MIDNSNVPNKLITSTSNEVDNLLLKTNNLPNTENKKEYKSIREYTPTGNMIYNQELLDKTITKINK